jgi:hypothetical protein
MRLILLSLLLAPHALAAPAAEEVCDEDNIDEDGDGYADDDDPDMSDDTKVLFFPDGDGDGYGDAGDDGDLRCDPDARFVTTDNSDCDDDDDSINPDAAETCDTVDQDCDGLIDEGWPDSDGDGLCDGLDEEQCDGLDNDGDATVDENGAVDATRWYRDDDDDGYGAPLPAITACDQPDGYVAVAGDCDDDDPSTLAAGDEYCDEIDNDCDAVTDEEALDGTTWYLDEDNDGYGDPATGFVVCGVSLGDVTDNTDCDDTTRDVYPGRAETCDSLDNDCDSVVDEASSDATTFYTDADGDGWGVAAEVTEACEAPDDTSERPGDCDDSDGDVSPSAGETWYDGVDSDCSGESDYDADRDGYVAEGYDAEAGGSAPGTGDCDDADPGVHPDALDPYYDGIDSDCVSADEFDADGDGHDSASYGGDDCDDADPDKYPGAPDEVYDGVVTDCDASDEYDADGDGYDSAEYGGDDCDDSSSAITPGGEETPYDGVDNDCDALTPDDDVDRDGYDVASDCDDDDADSYPGAPGLDTGCVAIDTAQPEDTGGETDEEKGCATAAGAASWLGAWLAVGALLRRRRRARGAARAPRGS